MAKRLMLTTLLAVLVIGPATDMPKSRVLAQEVTGCRCDATLNGYTEANELVAELTNYTYTYNYGTEGPNRCALSCSVWMINWSDVACSAHSLHHWTGSVQYDYYLGGSGYVPPSSGTC